MYKRILLVQTLLFTLTLSACSLHTIEQVAAGEDSKHAQLNERVGEFHRALYWGSVDEASTMILPESRQAFFGRFKSNRKMERMVDLQVEGITPNPDGSANVDVLIRSYKTTSYMVESRRETEHWEYMRLGGGWFLKDSAVTEADVHEDSPRFGRGSM